MQCACDVARQGNVEEILTCRPPTRGMLIPALQDIQDALGYVSPEAITAVAGHLNIPESSVYGVVTFYTQFYLTPQGRNKIKICEGTACHVRGSKTLARAVKNKIGIEPGETSEDGEFTVERVACIGSCALAPAVIGNGRIHGPMTPQKVEDLIDDIRENSGAETQA